jgi:hypothetical protein
MGRGRPAAKVDAAFFDQWNPEMAWALGLFFTDGHLRPRMGHAPARLYFTQKSPELLDKLKTLLQSDTRVHSHPRREYNGRTAGAVFRFAIANTHLCTRIQALGVTPRKSLTLRFPEIPADCVRHFIRGCWDGDGTVYRSYAGRRLAAKFGCGSQHFVEGMLSALGRDGFPERRLYRLKRNGQEIDYYYFRVPEAQPHRTSVPLPLRRSTRGSVSDPEIRGIRYVHRGAVFGV